MPDLEKTIRRLEDFIESYKQAFDDDGYAPLDDALSLLKAQELLKSQEPSVTAVPLEPLCQWLAGYAAPPNYALDEVRDDSIDPESLVYTANDRAKAWEFHFRELLKSGLMDTEE